MIIKVQFFARARELAGMEWAEVEIAEEATVGDLRRQLAQVFPSLASLAERSATSINEEFAEDNVIIPENARVALLPPVSGG